MNTEETMVSLAGATLHAALSRIRNMSDSALQSFEKRLLSDEGSAEYLIDIITEFDTPDTKLKPPEGVLVPFQLPDGNWLQIPEKFLEDVHDGYVVPVITQLVANRAEVSKWFMALAYTGFPFSERTYEITYNKNVVCIRIKGTDEMVSSMDAPDVASQFEDAAGEGFPILPRRDNCQPDCDDWCDKPDHLRNGILDVSPIDYSYGEGQYITLPQSNVILEESRTPLEMPPEGRKFLEIEFRKLSARGRLEHLRRVFHTKPPDRGDFDILPDERVGLSYLLYRGRIVSFGWNRNLPRIPDYRAAESNAPKGRYRTGDSVSSVKSIPG